MPSGKVVVRISGVKASPSGVDYVTVGVKNGAFSAELPDKGRTAQAFYIPPPNYGDCESAETPRN